MEVQAGAAQDMECQEEGQGVGQDSRKQDAASSLGQQPDTTRRGACQLHTDSTCSVVYVRVGTVLNVSGLYDSKNKEKL